MFGRWVRCCTVLWLEIGFKPPAVPAGAQGFYQNCHITQTSIAGLSNVPFMTFGEDLLQTPYSKLLIG